MFRIYSKNFEKSFFRVGDLRKGFFTRLFWKKKGTTLGPGHWQREICLLVQHKILNYQLTKLSRGIIDNRLGNTNYIATKYRARNN